MNNAYIEAGDLSWDVMEGWWTDAGTFESLLNASNLVAELRTRRRFGTAAIDSEFKYRTSWELNHR